MSNVIDSNGTPIQPRSCATCIYMDTIKTGPLNLQTQMVCRFGPPHLTMIPMNQGGQQGIANMVGHPPVSKEQWCYRHESVLTLPPAA